MFRLMAGAVAVAWALAGWSNLPRLEHPSAAAAGLAIGGCCLLCYLFGARNTRASAEASAWAHAEARAAAIASSTSAATSTAQVAVVISPELGARVAGQNRVSGLDAAPWMIGATRDPELEQDWIEQSVADGQEEGSYERAQ